jgi:hypothetical protein
LDEELQTEPRLEKPGLEMQEPEIGFVAEPESPSL